MPRDRVHFSLLIERSTHSVDTKRDHAFRPVISDTSFLLVLLFYLFLSFLCVCMKKTTDWTWFAPSRRPYVRSFFDLTVIIYTRNRTVHWNPKTKQKYRWETKKEEERQKKKKKWSISRHCFFWLEKNSKQRLFVLTVCLKRWSYFGNINLCLSVVIIGVIFLFSSFPFHIRTRRRKKNNIFKILIWNERSRRNSLNNINVSSASHPFQSKNSFCVFSSQSIKWVYVKELNSMINM